MKESVVRSKDSFCSTVTDHLAGFRRDMHCTDPRICGGSHRDAIEPTWTFRELVVNSRRFGDYHSLQLHHASITTFGRLPEYEAHLAGRMTREEGCDRWYGLRRCCLAGFVVGAFDALDRQLDTNIANTPPRIPLLNPFSPETHLDATSSPTAQDDPQYLALDG
jgi:hypothetical protein